MSVPQFEMHPLVPFLAVPGAPVEDCSETSVSRCLKIFHSLDIEKGLKEFNVVQNPALKHIHLFSCRTCPLFHIGYEKKIRIYFFKTDTGLASLTPIYCNRHSAGKDSDLKCHSSRRVSWFQLSVVRRPHF